MKDNIISGLLLMLMVFCVSCEEQRIIGGNPDGEYIAFFQFEDTSYLHKVLATPIKYCEHNPALYHTLGEKWAIGTYPKLLESELLFQYSNIRGRIFFNGTSFDIHDLTKGRKYIALNDGFYICYPFALLEREGVYLDVNWEELLSVKFDTINVIPAPYFPYNKRYIISEKKLAKLTGKSTFHFQKKSKEQVSIQDAIDIINKLIEHNELDKHCTVMYSDMITKVER